METTTGVFSDEYLDERLVGDTAWDDPANAELRRRADELATAWDELDELDEWTNQMQ